MAGTVNKAIVIGHLGDRPDIRKTQDGRQVATSAQLARPTARPIGPGHDLARRSESSP